jgi:hypothetical protein
MRMMRMMRMRILGKTNSKANGVRMLMLPQRHRDAEYDMMIFVVLTL